MKITKKEILNNKINYWNTAKEKAKNNERIKFCEKQIKKYKYKLKNSDYFSCIK